jgi:hypothetical protein
MDYKLVLKLAESHFASLVTVCCFAPCPWINRDRAIVDHNDNAASDIPTGPLRPSENNVESINLDTSVFWKIGDLRMTFKRWAADRETLGFERLRDVTCHILTQFGANSGVIACCAEARLCSRVKNKSLHS